MSPSIAAQPNRTSHNGPTSEADDVSMPTDARPSPLRQSVIGNGLALVRREHQRQRPPTPPPRRVQSSNLEEVLSTESGLALGRKILQLRGAMTARGIIAA